MFPDIFQISQSCTDARLASFQFSFKGVSNKVLIFSSFLFPIVNRIKRLSFFDFIKITGINLTSNSRDIRSSEVSDVIPIKSFEKRMRFKFIAAFYSFISRSNQFPNQINSSRTESGFFWNTKMFLPRNDLVTGFYRLVSIKRRIAYKHFKQNHPQASPINSFVVTLLVKNFRGYVVRSPNSWISQLSVFTQISPSFYVLPVVGRVYFCIFW